MARPKSVRAYIAAAPKDVRSKLRELRAAIKAAAPLAEERLSYGMPYYAYKGRVAYFAAFRNHISLFVPTPIIEEPKGELKAYQTTKATVHLAPDKRLPVALIKKLVKARLKKSEASK